MTLCNHVVILHGDMTTSWSVPGAWLTVYSESIGNTVCRMRLLLPRIVTMWQ
jgi:hypothetical protein